MKWLGFLALSLLLSGCSFLQEKPQQSLWTFTGVKPRRTALLVLEAFPQDLRRSFKSPDFDSLNTQALFFEKAWVGHLLTSPLASFSVITQGVLPKNLKTSNSFWLEDLPGSKDQKKIIDFQTSSGLVSEAAIDFFKSQPQWSLLVARIPKNSADQEVKKILSYLENSGLLAETLLLITSEQGESVPGGVYSKTSALPSWLKPLASTPWKSLEADSTLRFFLGPNSRKTLTALTRDLKKLPEVSELFYRKEISKKTYYIRSYRSSSLSPEDFDWSKIHTPILLQSIAAPRGPDLVAFLSTPSLSQERVQRIPLWIWAPHLRLNNSAIRSQMEKTPARLVDLAPMIFELLGEKLPPNLDGTPLGISSVLN